MIDRRNKKLDELPSSEGRKNSVEISRKGKISRKEKVERMIITRDLEIGQRRCGLLIKTQAPSDLRQDRTDVCATFAPVIIIHPDVNAPVR